MTIIEFKLIKKMTLIIMGSHYSPMESSNGAEIGC